MNELTMVMNKCNFLGIHQRLSVPKANLNTKHSTRGSRRAGWLGFLCPARFTRKKCPIWWRKSCKPPCVSALLVGLNCTFWQLSPLTVYMYIWYLHFLYLSYTQTLAYTFAIYIIYIQLYIRYNIHCIWHLKMAIICVYILCIWNLEILYIYMYICIYIYNSEGWKTDMPIILLG